MHGEKSESDEGKGEEEEGEKNGKAKCFVFLSCALSLFSLKISPRMYF